jgi:SPX domain protein involved in polyphosphate accumulation
MNEKFQDLQNNFWYFLGRASGIQDLAKKFRKDAGERFANDKDDEAHFLRKLSIDIDKMADAERAKSSEFKAEIDQLKKDEEDERKESE